MEISELHDLFLNSSGLSTDTRSIQEGCLFLALKGPNFNGNKFASQAIEKGARYAIVDEEEGVLGEGFILVQDCLKTLQNLANYHRNQFELPVIGLTGSNGKTTTKELIREVLSRNYQVLATEGNLNNHIGVPLTLLRLSANTEVAIIEMGANRLGEIAELCAIAEPTHGLITNIGKAHIGTFGGFENIIRGKSELFDWLIRSEGTIWINTQDEVLKNMARRMREPKLYPMGSDDRGVRFISADPFVSYEDDAGEVVQTQLIGQYNFINIAAAMAVGREFGISLKETNEAVRSYVPENNRSQVIEKGTNTLILDAYNANPSSMSKAIENMAEMETSKAKLLILGDMYELGDQELPEHQAIGTLANSLKLRALYVGGLMSSATKADPMGLAFPDKKSLGNYLKDNPVRDSLVLIKGSRGMKLEEVVEYL